MTRHASSRVPTSDLDLSLEQGLRRFTREPYYLPAGDEIGVFTACHARGLPVMLKGPTGCGKTRFVEHMAWRLGRPLVTIACQADI
jgi:nitric oxide reductase NorQ protein